MPNIGTINLPLAGGNTLVIGEVITGGIPNALLYTDGASKLASSANLTWTGTDLVIGTMLGLVANAQGTTGVEIGSQDWEVLGDGTAHFTTMYVANSLFVLSGGITSVDDGSAFTDGNGLWTMNGLKISGGQIQDQNGAPSIDPLDRFLFAADGSLALNYYGPGVSMDGGNVSTDGVGTLRCNVIYMGGYIADNTGTTESIDPNGRNLYNSGGTILGNWSGSVFNAPNGLTVATGLTVTSGVLTLSSDANVSGNIAAVVAGKGLTIKGGTNARIGTLTLNGTTAVVVANTSVTANSEIFLTINTGAGTVGAPYISARTAGTSFSVKSTAVGDTSTCSYMIVEKT